MPVLITSVYNEIDGISAPLVSSRVSTQSSCIAATCWCFRGCLFFFTSSNLTEATSKLLSKKDRQYLVCGSIVYYEYLCHDCHEEDDMTPAEYYGLLVKMTDAEFIADNDVFFIMTDTNETLYASAEDFYDTWSSYIPEEYWIM